MYTHFRNKKAQATQKKQVFPEKTVTHTTCKEKSTQKLKDKKKYEKTQNKKQRKKIIKIQKQA